MIITTRNHLKTKSQLPVAPVNQKDINLVHILLVMHRQSNQAQIANIFHQVTK